MELESKIEDIADACGRYNMWDYLLQEDPHTTIRDVVHSDRWLHYEYYDGITIAVVREEVDYIYNTIKNKIRHLITNGKMPDLYLGERRRNDQ